MALRCTGRSRRVHTPPCAVRRSKAARPAALRRVSCGDDRQTNEGDREPAAFRYEAQYALASLQLSGLQQAIEQQIERGRANIAFLGEIGEPARLRNFPVIGHPLTHHVEELLPRLK